MKLGVNVDHAATLRQARFTTYPDPAAIALLCERAGCHSIVAHLREDRRHIQDRDVALIKRSISILFNLEMSIAPAIVAIALKLLPKEVTLVPEKRQELTTEGGIDLARHYAKVECAIDKFKKKKIKVSLFIDPSKNQIDLAKRMCADLIELNTGEYSEAKTQLSHARELKKIKVAAEYAKEKGFFVAAGHGIDYENVKSIVNIDVIEELNIGHSIICRSLSVGIERAVKEMLVLMKR